jgi:hypothetical protein
MKSQNCYLTDRLCVGQDDLPQLLQVSPRKGIFQCKVTFLLISFERNEADAECGDTG